MPPLVHPLSSETLAGHEAVCFPSGQAHPSISVQGENIRSPPSPSSPILAFPDVVLGVGLSSGGLSVGDSNQKRPAVSAPGQNSAPTSRDLEVVGMANQRSPITFDLSDVVHETIIIEGSIPPNGGFSNPGVQLMPWTQLKQLPSCFSAGVLAR